MDNWVISQTWKHILFLNFKVAPEEIRKRLPTCLSLDTYQGDAFLSVVPFRMEGIRFPYTPVLPFSSLWELNLRTYVTYKGRPGIYFFTLDTDHLLSEWIANSFFHLPYRYRSMRASFSPVERLYQFEALGSLESQVLVSKTPLVTSSLSEWLVERYSLYTIKKGKLYRGDVIHDPWDLHFSKVVSLKEGLCEEFFPQVDTELENSFYSPELPVSFKPFQRLL